MRTTVLHGIFINTCYSGRSSCPVPLLSFGLLDGPQVPLCRPHLKEAAAGFGAQPLRDGTHESSANRRHLNSNGFSEVRFFTQMPRAIAGCYARPGMLTPAMAGIPCKRIDDLPATCRLITNPDMVRYSLPILVFESF
jgi:hypothetical protein